MSAPAPPALDVPPGWTAYDLHDPGERDRAVATLLAPTLTARSALPAGEAQALSERLFAADADWLLLPDDVPDVLALLFVRPPAADREPQHPGPDWTPVPGPDRPPSEARLLGRWRRHRVLVDEKLILVDDLAVIGAPAADVVLAVTVLATDRPAAPATDGTSVISPADVLIAACS